MPFQFQLQFQLQLPLGVFLIGQAGTSEKPFASGPGAWHGSGVSMTLQTPDMTPFSGLAPLCFTPVREEVIVQETICQHRGGAEQRRNDDLLLTRQARELADQAATIQGLESRLAHALATDPITVVLPTSAALDPGSNPTRITSHETTETVINVHVQEVTVQPTVFTNIGSLLDVFA
jgi:hypothetical protein